MRRHHHVRGSLEVNILFTVRRKPGVRHHTVGNQIEQKYLQLSRRFVLVYFYYCRNKGRSIVPVGKGNGVSGNLGSVHS